MKVLIVALLVGGTCHALPMPMEETEDHGSGTGGPADSTIHLGPLAVDPNDILRQVSNMLSQLGGLVYRIGGSAAFPIFEVSDSVDYAERVIPDNLNQLIEDNAKAVLNLTDIIKDEIAENPNVIDKIRERLSQSETHVGQYLDYALSYLPGVEEFERGVDYISPIVDAIAPDQQ